MLTATCRSEKKRDPEFIHEGSQLKASPGNVMNQVEWRFTMLRFRNTGRFPLPEQIIQVHESSSARVQPF